jgi:hypothetical protein
MNVGQTNVALSKHGGNWTFRARQNGKHKRFMVCPIDGPDSLDKVSRQQKANKMLTEINAGNNPAPVSSEPKYLTVKVAGDSWLQWAQTRRREPIGKSTAESYGHNLKRWIYPNVGDLYLWQLKSMQAKQVVDAMHTAGASSSVVNDVITNMQQVLESVKDADGQPLYNWKLDRDVMDAPKVQQTETKAFTAEQIEASLQRLQGQYKVLFALLAGTGLRIGEALAIEIDGDPEKVTTLSKDCRVLYVQSILDQDGEVLDDPKTQAGIREVDICQPLADMLSDLIGNRTSGFLFCTESGSPILYSNLMKNVFNPLMWDRERPIMRREGKGWKKVGSEKLPGVIGDKADFQEKENGRTGYGMHSFRRFRETYLHLEGVPERVVDFWTGHGPETMGELYTKIKSETAKRREWCDKAGLGFSLQVKKQKVVKIKTKGKVKAA